MIPALILAAAVATAPAAPQGAAAVTGTASWGYGWSGAVTRLPRGTRIRVCGPLACWSGRSVGYGPDARLHRIADLSRPLFARLCGDPSMGLCKVRITLPRGA